MYRYELPVIEMIKLSPSAKAIRLGLEGREFPFIPGQFVQVEIALEEKGSFKLHDKPNIQKRSLSISSSPGEKRYLELTIKEVPHGLVSGYMVHHLKLGDTLKILGPLGHFVFKKEETKKHVIFLAAGSGIAPFMSMLRSIADNCPAVNGTLFYSNKNTEEILWRQEIEKIIEKNKNLSCILTLTRQQWEGTTGRIDKKLIFSKVQEKENTDFYICGSPDFVKSMEALLKAEGIPKESIKKEIF